MVCGDAFGADRITVTVDTGEALGAGATAVPRTEVRAGRVHVVSAPGIATVEVGDDVSVTVRGGCRCPAKPTPGPGVSRPPRPPVAEPARPPSSRPPATRPTARPARALPTPTRTTPTRTPAPPRPTAPAAAVIRPAPRGVPIAEPEPPPPTQSLRVVAAPPEEDPADSGFANWIAPALVVSIVPAALAALTPGAGRRGVRT